MKVQIYFNEVTQQYTLNPNNSIKKVPLRYKTVDSTRRFRIETLKKKILKE